MIIDCHCHAGNGDGLTGPWDTARPLDALPAPRGAAGIDRTVLFAAFHSDYAVANREVARIVARRPGASSASPSSTPSATAGGSGRWCGVAVERYGFRGIKVHRHDARITPRGLRGGARASACRCSTT